MSLASRHRGWALIGTLLLGSLTVGCSASFRVMERDTDTSFPGSRASADQLAATWAAWTRTETLGVRGEAQVTMIDPSLGARMLAAQAAEAGREPTEGYDREIWDQFYGERGERLPFDVRWRFDRLFQPKRTANPRIGWTFELRDDHGRSWEALAIGDVHESADHDAWIGSFRVWFPTADVVTGPLFDGRTRKVTLRVTGAPGMADFVWKFRPDIGAGPERMP